MKILYFVFFLSFFLPSQIMAQEVSDWLKKEIDIILDAYKNENMSKETRFLMIEDTINYNFAGTGIAKFVAGDSWKTADKDTKKEYIKFFKRHLALNIASMMQGYSNEEYALINSQYDSKNKITLIDMEIYNDTGSLIVTWRVKKSKDRYYVIDLLVADISIVVTKRSEFNSMLKNVNYSLKELNIILKKQNETSYQKLIN
tara:strand:+ start:104 stop:706 length:603 start_codon:yes stop_codon:yes gene_type:complete